VRCCSPVGFKGVVAACFGIAGTNDAHLFVRLFLICFAESMQFYPFFFSKRLVALLDEIFRARCACALRYYADFVRPFSSAACDAFLITSVLQIKKRFLTQTSPALFVCLHCYTAFSAPFGGKQNNSTDCKNDATEFKRDVLHDAILCTIRVHSVAVLQLWFSNVISCLVETSRGFLSLSAFDSSLSLPHVHASHSLSRWFSDFTIGGASGPMCAFCLPTLLSRPF